MKNKTRFILFFCGIILVCIVTVCFVRNKFSRPTIELTIEDGNFVPANYKQYSSYLMLGSHNGKLYMWNKQKQTLYCFENSSFRKYARLNGQGIGFHNGFFYYRKDSGSEGYTIYYYDLETGDRGNVVLNSALDYRDISFTENGTLTVPAGNDAEAYFIIDGAKCIGETAQQENYQIGENTYYLDGEREQAVLIATDPHGKRISYDGVIPYGLKSMIPCGNGMLIHNETNGDFLYYIEAETGKAMELFTTDCIYAYSAVNVYDGYAFLSFVRYTDWGSLGIAGKRDENDEINGTYKISLEDCTVQKISNEIYNGLFIFNDTGIFACNDDMQVFLLDFDGNVQAKLTR